MYIVWAKYFKIAERQLEARKYKTVERHALKALEFARKSNDEKQIAQTLSLLGNFYLFTKNPKLVETLRESARMAEIAYGPGSVELSDELVTLAYALEISNESESEAIRNRAITILEGLDEEWRRLSDLLLDAARDYLESERFVEAESSFLKALAIIKRECGPTSEDVVRWSELYLEIQEALGKPDEALESILKICPSCLGDGEHIHEDKVSDEILSKVNSIMKGGDTDESIEAIREGLADAAVVLDNRVKGIDSSDPYYELKLVRFRDNERYLKSSLAQVLRVRGFEERNHEDLVEAIEHLRQLVNETPSFSNQAHLAMAMMDDICLGGTSYLEEIEPELEKLPPCAAKLYTKALLMFIQSGSTSASRAAMMDAIRCNHHVPLAMGTGEFKSYQGNYFTGGEESEAHGYCLEAVHHWVSTPGSSEFIIDVLARSMPADLRRELAAMSEF